MNGLEIDLETRSDIDLRSHGAYCYFESPNADVLMASWRIGDVRGRWRREDPCPPEIVAHVEAGGTISAHNASFERLAWRYILTPRYGWPQPRLEQFRCTAATAAAMALPRDLAGLAGALGLKVQKDKNGMRLIRKFSIPRKPRKDEPPGLHWNEPEDDPQDFEKFHAYCDIDVAVEAAADRRMVPLSEDEQEMYIIDQRVNDRGLRIDMRSARAALRLAAEAKKDLDRRMRVVTGGYVKACTNVGQLTDWVAAQGIPLASAAKADIEELLATDDLPATVRTALELRQEAAKTSVSKLEAFIKRAGRDGRVRGAFLYHAASTGRWSSIGAQVHNMPRPRPQFEDAKLRKDVLFATLRTGDPDFVRLAYGDDLGRPLHLLADSIRGFIWAAPGHDLLVADYSGIEGVVAAWLCGEHWKVRAIREIAEDPSKPDLYRRAAAGIFNVSVEDIAKKDDRRQVGKVSELSLQYQGGPGAFRSMARNYGMKLGPIYPIVWEAADDERRERAVRRYESACARGEPVTTLLNREEFLAAEIVKLGWREVHPAISGAWPALEDAARQAVETPGQIISVMRCDYLVAKGFLWCRLPSGRCLAYGSPRMKEQVWFRRKDAEVAEPMGRTEAVALVNKGEGEIEGNAQPKVTALGVNSVTKKWERFGLYGGLALENIVQAVARDLLANGIRKAEAAGYPVIGHVHDEILTEVPRGFGDVDAFEKLICELPPWAEDLPLTAGGWRGKRYRKD